jgi:hypothetical protein
MKARHVLTRSGFSLSLWCLVAGPGALLGQDTAELTPGKLTEGIVGSTGGASFRFEAASAGVLTVAARSKDESDIFLIVTDADGQSLPNGRSDQDLGGNSGAEQFAVTLPRAGEYLVRVENFGGKEIPFKLGVSWLPFPDLGVPTDPDGSPRNAVPIRVGQDTREDSLNGVAGDHWDWFVLKVEKGGTLTVATRADEGDLILEAYSPDKFGEAMERSDQDLQGRGGNEALTLVVHPGDVLFFRVSAFSEGSTIPYKLQVGLIPN